MSFLSRTTVVRFTLSCAVGVALAAACGSSDDKKTNRADEAGASGANQAGSAASGDDRDAQGGALGEPSAGQGGNPLPELGGAGGTAPMGGGETGEAGQAGQAGAGGAPFAGQCTVDGTVTGLSVVTEAIYQGCRGSLVHVSFSADSSSDAFRCCGASTSEPSFAAPALGVSNHDGGGNLEIEVPADAPIGSYVMNLDCPTQPNDHAFQLEINDAAAPVVTGVDNDQIKPTDALLISGENLDSVSSVIATRSSDGSIVFCNIDAASRTASSISCTFSNIQNSTDNTDIYVLEVASETCGAARSHPSFTVLTPE